MLHQKKIMVTVWWSAIGVIHYSFLAVHETINAERYCNDLAVMHARLSEKRPALVNRRGPILLHDNARPHVARMIVQKLTELGYETLPHPPYSPDLSPTDYHLFKHLSTFLYGKTFRSKQEPSGDTNSAVELNYCGFDKPCPLIGPLTSEASNLRGPRSEEPGDRKIGGSQLSPPGY
ncbi:Transposase type 1 [Trinorchestia longiramus]|nr:Transposase type 1 [Trinorchestia longiramus]